MLRPGLVSATFRALSPREVIAACLNAQLEGIEWSGDVHAPPDDLKNARDIGQMTREAGLEVAAFGSYWRCDDAPFEPILATALALGAPTIRVWPGATDARDAADLDWTRVAENLRSRDANGARDERANRDRISWRNSDFERAKRAQIDGKNGFANLMATAAARRRFRRAHRRESGRFARD